jgi:energy-coupling factor transporter ATP-binding protein EcfA2
MPALDEILTWSSNAPAWLRDLLRRIATSAELTGVDIAELAELCKQPHGLSTSEAKANPLSAKDIPGPTDAGAVALASITHVADVNALAPNEILSFAPTGLTVIYGDNGAGKSGFSRILRRACRARGADDPILANALSDKPAGAPTARIDYAVAGTARSFAWKDGVAGAPELSAVSVFDSAAAQVYVEEKTELRFRPFGLDVIDRAASTCVSVKKLLDGEVEALQARAIKLPAIAPHTEAGRLLATLTALTPRKEVDRLGTMTPDEQKELDSLTGILAAAKAEDPKKKAADLRLKAGRLRRLADELRELSSQLAATSIKNLLILTADAARSEADARRFAAELAKGLGLEGVGSPAWTETWEAAKGYSETHAYPGHQFPHLADGALCVLCQQELEPLAKDRMRRLVELVVGEAQQTARHQKDSADNAKHEIVRLQPGDRNKDAIADLQAIDADVAANVDVFLAAARACHADVAAGVPDPKSCSNVPPLAELEGLAIYLEKRADEFTRAADPTARAKSEERLAELASRQTLAASVADVHDEIDRRARLNAYDQCIKDTETRALTKLSGELTKKYVTDALTAAFDAELKRLGFTALDLELKPASAQRGQLLHRVQLKHATRAVLPKVVSEGESRCIALAAFMAELEGAGHDSGMVFDDPVSSLDHHWRNNVALRLVETARTRQVIVFTHELVFLHALLHEAERLDVPSETHTLSRDREYAGHVAAGLPFSALSTKKRIGPLRDRWVKAEKAFRVSGQDDYDPLATKLYADLRRTWERAVEEVLLNQVVLRFRPGVETQRLKKIGDINQVDLDAVEQGMTKCSKWEGGHDQALAMNERLPPPDELKLDIDALDNWVNAVEKRRK